MSPPSLRPTAPPTEAALEKRLTSARVHCSQRGAQLTAQRAEVLELLLRRGGQAKAYDLQGDMQTRHGRIAPTTVYRALDFLQDQHLVHKVDATNTFVVCNHANHSHPTLLLICTECGRVEELRDTQALTDLVNAILDHGFSAQAVEVRSLCANCRTSK